MTSDEISKLARQAGNETEAPQHAAQQRPVAWKWRYKNGELSVASFDTRAQCERNSDDTAGEAVPLYTAPQPASQPLTEARVHDLLVAVCSDGSAPSLQEVKEQAPEIFELARAIEAAHGITEGQQGIKNENWRTNRKVT